MTMLTSALDLSNLGTTVGSTTAKTSNNATDAQSSQDRFLKLLVAQINNQDPLNPMDNAQMTTQMAQINTVSGIQQLNDTLKSMASQSAGMQGAALIGRHALVEGNTLAFDGTTGTGAYNLAADAKTVEVDVIGSSGQVLETLKLGAQGAGQHTFDWDAGSIDPTTVTKFVVRSVADNGDAVANTALSPQKVDSVSFANGAITLQLANGRAVAYTQARGFM